MANRFDTVALREEYLNRFHDLQYKYRKEEKKLIIIILLSIYFLEHFSHPYSTFVQFGAPFISKIKNIDKPKVVINAVEKGINSKGKLEKHIKEFVEINNEQISSLTNIIPQKAPKIKEITTDYYEYLKEKTQVIENHNAISLWTNQFIFFRTIKQWNTQRDKRVRKTVFHQNIDRQVVKINEKFIVGNSAASYPADSELPPYERFNCRCYLTYY